MRLRTGVVIICAMISGLSGGLAAAADEPKLLGSFKDWFVYAAGKGANRTCFAVSMPMESTPANLNRDKVSFLISWWPAQKTRNEPSIVAGYQFKPMSVAVAQIGSDKFEFNRIQDSGAWMENPTDEQKLIAAMKHGSSMSITGTSSRGTLTHDSYSLAGISAALEKLAASCK